MLQRALLEYVEAGENGNILSRTDVVAVSWNDEETVRAAEGGDIAGALPGQGVDPGRGLRPFEAGGEKVAQARLFTKGLGESGL